MASNHPTPSISPGQLLDDPADQFERERRYLTGLAYRMLGSLMEAEDAVQEAYLRWHRSDRTAVQCVRAFLSKIVARICLDQMKSARVRRETYIGPWLPEPVLDEQALDAETSSEYATDLSVGLMLALERLSPLERAAFLLHDVFDVEYGEVAQLLERDESACRQLAARARDHVRQSRPRYHVAPETGDRILQAFIDAYRTGDVATLATLLAQDATLHTDGGGKRKAALKPIVGRDKIVRLYSGKAGKRPVSQMRPAMINGLRGCIVTFADGRIQTVALEMAGLEIKAMYVVLNPEKLKHLAESG